MAQKSDVRAGRVRVAAWVALSAVAAIAGCRPTGGDAVEAVRGSRRPVVVATTSIVGDLVREIAGDRVEVDCLMGAGVDPHSYRATPQDASRLAAADLVVASGLHLEGKLADLLTKLAKNGSDGKPKVVFAAEAIPREKLIEVAGDLVDPHVWFDPALWRLGIPAVARAITAIDPDGGEGHAARAEVYGRKLDDLDRTLRDRFAAIAEAKRVLVTAHDAFGYFGRAYGIEVVGVQGVSTESEAGLADINRIVSLIVDRGIPSVFVETSVSDRNVEAICEGVRAKGGEVRIGGRLYSDALGEPGSGADTLLGMLDRNADTILEGLGAR